MSNRTRILLLAVAALLAAGLGYWVRVSWMEPAAPVEMGAVDGGSGAGEVVPPLSLPDPAADGWLDPAAIRYPRHAIADELVLRFDDPARYQAFVDAAKRAGIGLKGRIDALGAVRVGADLLTRLDPGEYGARVEYSYQAIEPPPPVELSPEQMASLRSLGKTGAGLVDGRLDGTGAGVTVAVIDSGFAEHPFFEDSSIALLDLTGAGMEADGAAHGTSVASIIAGAEGIAPEADLIAIRVMDETGLGSSFTAAEAIVRAVEEGAQVINLSLGVYADSPVLHHAVAYAYDRGVVMVAAGGNDGTTGLLYPAAYPQVVAVTAVDAKGRHALFPNQSGDLDIAAPGVGVVAATVDGEETLFTGTSAAAPVVAGTIAALLSEDPLQRGEHVVNTLGGLLNDAGAIGTDPAYGRGVLDFDRIRERDSSDVVDLALADIHVDPTQAPGRQVPVTVLVQNRGTAWIAEATMEVVIKGVEEPWRFPLESLGRGASTVRTVYGELPLADPDPEVEAPTLTVFARVVLDADLEDRRPDNNERLIEVQPLQDSP